MAVFKNKFLSTAGQKERIGNVGKVLGIATGVYNPNKQTLVTAKGKKNAITTIASHPFMTAGVVAGGITALGGKITASGTLTKGSINLLKSSSARASRITSSIPTTAGAGASLSRSLLPVAVGIGAGAVIFGKGRGGSGGSGTGGTGSNIIDQTPQQDTSSIAQPFKKDTGSLIDNPSINSGRDTFYNTRKRLSQDQYTYSYAVPYQDTSSSPLATGGAGTGGEGGSSGTDWVMIALIVGGAYLLSRRD